MPGESTLTDLARAVSTPIEFGVGALEDGGEQANQADPRRRMDHRDVELTVGVIGLGADQHAAAVALGVAEGSQCQVGADLLTVVERQPERQRPKLRHLGDHREVVAHPAVRPAHAIGAVADQRVETGRHHGAEPLLHAGMVVDAAEVDGFRPAVNYHVGGRLGIPFGKAVFARVVVAGAGRNDAQRDVAECQ